MKIIELQKLKLTNFKGIKSLEINFNKDLTNILGDNGTGKTTVFDAFTWLLFGKDHNDSAKFEIKTLDGNNIPLSKLEHEVEAILNIDGDIVTLSKVYKEKWVKQRGSLEAVLTGHVTDCFYNNVPVTLTEYQKKVNLLINEQLFKLITNPFNFNALPWITRRNILVNLVSKISNKDIAKSDKDFEALLLELSGKTLNEYKREINSTKKRYREQISEIPTRIDETYNSLPQKQDWKAIEKLISDKKAEEEKLMAQLIDFSKIDDVQLEKVRVKQSEVNRLTQESDDYKENLRNVEREKFNNHQEQKSKIEDEIQSVGYNLSKLDKLIIHEVEERRKLETDIVKLRQEFGTTQTEKLVLEEIQFSCPTCKREFEPFKIEEMKGEMTANFNTSKSEKLENINIKGKHLKGVLEKKKQFVKDLENEKSKITTKLDNLENQLADINRIKLDSVKDILFKDTEYQKLLEKIDTAKTQLEQERNTKATSDDIKIKELEASRDKLYDEIGNLKKSLYQKDQISQGEARIKALENDLKTASQNMANLEKKEFVLERFVSEKMSRIEKSINDKFPTINFKLFCNQLNGGVSECCETLVNGVPFSDANSASKIKAGIEIINVLTKYHECSAPIFVDNSESIVLTPITESQLIRLVVSENHKCLTIN